MTRRVHSWSTNYQLNALVGDRAVLLLLSAVWLTFTYENIVRMLQSHVQNPSVVQRFSAKTSRPTERPAAGDQSFVLPVIKEWTLRVQRCALVTLNAPISLSPFLGASE
jgi:hypothetical protein